MRTTEYLRSLPLFQAVSDSVLEELRTAVHTKHFRKNQLIYTQGAEPSGLYFILHGHVQIYKTLANDDEVLLHKLGVNDVVGEVQLIVNRRYEDAARAEDHTETLFLPRKDFERIIRKNPSAHSTIALSLSRKLNEIHARITDEHNKTQIAVIHHSGDQKLKAKLAIDLALSLKEQTGRKVLLIDLLSNPQDVSKILQRKLLYDYIIINLPPFRSAASIGLIACTDLLLTFLPEASYARYLNPRLKVVDINAATLLDTKRADWYIGHLARVIAKRTIGLALGSGTTGGLAHIGVMRYIQENNIPVDMIAGCSGGALYGALWSLKKDWKYAKTIVNERKGASFWSYLDFSWSMLGLAKGNKIARQFQRYFPKDLRIEELSIPFAIVTTNLTKSREEIFTRGPIWQAIRASISIPIIFTPVKIKHDLYIDGFISDPLPVSYLRKQGMHTIIAVYASQHTKISPTPKNFIDVYMQSRAQLNDRIAFLEAEKADYFINPDVSEFGTFAYEEADKLINIGYETAKQTLKGL